VLLIPIRGGDVPLGSLELLRAGRGFDPKTGVAFPAAPEGDDGPVLEAVCCGRELPRSLEEGEY
jgi:hypothetical protein